MALLLIFIFICWVVLKLDDSNKILDDMRDRLFSLLESECISQKEFSENLGVSPQTITDWKKGKSRSFTQKLPLIASILHCDLNWLVDGVGDPTPKRSDEALDRLLEIDHESRFVKFDGTYAHSDAPSPPPGKKERPAPTPPPDLWVKFNSLTPEGQKEVIAFIEFKRGQESQS